MKNIYLLNAHKLSRFLPLGTAGLSLTIATIAFGNVRGALPYTSSSDDGHRPVSAKLAAVRDATSFVLGARVKVGDPASTELSLSQNAPISGLAPGSSKPPNDPKGGAPIAATVDKLPVPKPGEPGSWSPDYSVASPWQNWWHNW
jgi:hypothetical protein